MVKNTPKVTGFLGGRGRPTPITEAEAQRIMHQVEEGLDRPKMSITFEIGDQVRVSDGPFTSFNGNVEEVDEERARLKVSVSIFGRVRSISATVAEDGNGSSSRRNIFYRDTTFGWYLGWSRDVDTINTDGQWVSIAPAGTDDAALQAGHDYGWTNLGVNAGADEDYATYAYVLRNYGPFGFTLPVIGYQYTMLVDIGTPSDYTTLTVTIYLAARA